MRFPAHAATTPKSINVQKDRGVLRVGRPRSVTQTCRFNRNCRIMLSFVPYFTRKNKKDLVVKGKCKKDFKKFVKILSR